MSGFNLELSIVADDSAGACVVRRVEQNLFSTQLNASLQVDLQYFPYHSSSLITYLLQELGYTG